MVGNVDQGEEDAQVVAPLQVSNSCVNVFRMQAMIPKAGWQVKDNRQCQGRETFRQPLGLNYLRKRAQVVRAGT